MVKHLTALRYVTPLREGGSLPALVEADDGKLYVLKFRGAGQGHKALIAEWIAGEIARVLGLPVPEIVFMELDARLGISEPDGEIRDLVKASAGLNLALAYQPSALTFDPLAGKPPDAMLASQIVWFDAFVTNVDRTMRNTNLLLWDNRLWLIDHGASLYFHHTWQDYIARSRQPFAAIKSHVLLPYAGALAEADAMLAPQMTAEALRAIVAAVPDVWLTDEPMFATPEDVRTAYLDYLLNRIVTPRDFVTEAIHAHARTV